MLHYIRMYLLLTRNICCTCVIFVSIWNLDLKHIANYYYICYANYGINANEYWATLVTRLFHMIFLIFCTVKQTYVKKDDNNNTQKSDKRNNCITSYCLVGLEPRALCTVQLTIWHKLSQSHSFWAAIRVIFTSPWIKIIFIIMHCMRIVSLIVIGFPTKWIHCALRIANRQFQCIFQFNELDTFADKSSSQLNWTKNQRIY